MTLDKVLKNFKEPQKKKIREQYLLDQFYSEQVDFVLSKKNEKDCIKFLLLKDHQERIAFINKDKGFFKKIKNSLVDISEPLKKSSKSFFHIAALKATALNAYRSKTPLAVVSLGIIASISVSLAGKLLTDNYSLPNKYFREMKNNLSKHDKLQVKIKNTQDPIEKKELIEQSKKYLECLEIIPNSLYYNDKMSIPNKIAYAKKAIKMLSVTQRYIKKILQEENVQSTFKYINECIHQIHRNNNLSQPLERDVNQRLLNNQDYLNYLLNSSKISTKDSLFAYQAKAFITVLERDHDMYSDFAEKSQNNYKQDAKFFSDEVFFVYNYALNTISNVAPTKLKFILSPVQQAKDIVMQYVISNKTNEVFDKKIDLFFNELLATEIKNIKDDQQKKELEKASKLMVDFLKKDSFQSFETPNIVELKILETRNIIIKKIKDSIDNNNQVENAFNVLKNVMKKAQKIEKYLNYAPSKYNGFIEMFKKDSYDEFYKHLEMALNTNFNNINSKFDNNFQNSNLMPQKSKINIVSKTQLNLIKDKGKVNTDMVINDNKEYRKKYKV